MTIVMSARIVKIVCWFCWNHAVILGTCPIGAAEGVVGGVTAGLLEPEFVGFVSCCSKFGVVDGVIVLEVGGLLGVDDITDSETCIVDIIFSEADCVGKRRMASSQEYC
jgi:hypothetical protein